MVRTLTAWATALAVALTVSLVSGASPPAAARDRPSRLPGDSSPATLTGVVRGSDGSGLPGVTVVARTLSDWNVRPQNVLWDGYEDAASERAAVTAADGSYKLYLPDPVVYRLEFRPALSGPSAGYVGTFWGGGAVVSEAEDIAIDSAQSYPGFDVTLETGRGEIAGRFLDDRGRGAVARLRVMRDGSYVGDVVSDESGQFRVPADPGVPYQLMRNRDGDFPHTWFPGVTSPELAGDVRVGDDASFQLVSRDSAITGRVTTTAGQPIEGVLVMPWRAGPPGAWTDADGYYRLEVQAGTYRVCAHSSPQFAGECWSDTPFVLDSTPIRLERWETQSGVDFDLEAAAFAQTAGNQYPRFTYMKPYKWDSRTGRWREPAHGERGTGPGIGFYLAPGRYRFQFAGDAWWPSGSSIEEAQDVVLRSGDSVELTAPPEADESMCSSSISGRVLDANGFAVWRYVKLVAVGDDGRPVPIDDPRYWYSDWREGTTDYFADGVFAFTDLPAGRYRIRFGDVTAEGTGDRAGWWPRRDTFSEAGDLMIDGPGVQLSGVDSRSDNFYYYPVLAGTVTDDRGAPVVNARVRIERFDDAVGAWTGTTRRATTNATGHFFLPAMTGDYRVRIETPWQSELGDSWWMEAGETHPAIVRVAADPYITDAGTMVVHDVPATAAADDTPPPSRPALPSPPAPTRTECPSRSGVPAPSTSPSTAPTPPPATAVPPSPSATSPQPVRRDGRMRIRSPRPDVVLVHNREGTRMRLVIGGRRYTLAPQGRIRLRFARAVVRWHASWHSALLEDTRGRIRVL